MRELRQASQSRAQPLLQSRSPARAKMYDVELDTDKGSVIVLSPVKESSGSSKRIATPVRRSLRTAAVTTEEKNKEALKLADYTYAPNQALTGGAPGPSTPPFEDQDAQESVRRSARKTKSVEKLSPRFNGKVY